MVNIAAALQVVFSVLLTCPQFLWICTQCHSNGENNPYNVFKGLGTSLG